MPLDDATRAAIRRRIEAAAEHDANVTLASSLTAHHFLEQAAYIADRSRLKAKLCGRRAGKSRSSNEEFVREAMVTPGGRFLIINKTGSEVRAINWLGLKGDGIASLVERHQIPCKLDTTMMIATFSNGAVIRCMGVDDEAAIGKALGLAYHRVLWDEAQKIPPKFEQTIREVFMPTLLDFGGAFELSGSPSRQMAGLFYEVTHPNPLKRKPGWGLHQWNLLSNTFFGHVEQLDGMHSVVDKMGAVVAQYHDRNEADAHAVDLRHRDGILDLQYLYGGPDVAPLDSPIMQREAFGRWVHEDALYVYAYHRVPKTASLFFAPHRARGDGFVDIPKALSDLPGWGRVEYVLALGADLAYFPDAFAFTIWAWTLDDPRIFEVVSWKKTHLDSRQQAQILHSVRAVCQPSIWVADAGGTGRFAVSGWSNEWMERYGIPFNEADKHNKHVAGGPIDNFNVDMLTLVNGEPRMRLREGSPLGEELSQIQYASVTSATGKLFEDPTIPNDCADSALYAHRHAWHHRYLETPERPQPGTPEYDNATEQEMRRANVSPQDDEDFEIAPIGW